MRRWLSRLGTGAVLLTALIFLGAPIPPTSSTPTISSGSVSSATTSTEGIVELATSREDAANKVVQGNDARLDPFVGSGPTAATGLVPAPSGVSGTTEFLREDGTWAEIDATFAAGVELTDNTADAFNVGEGANDYLIFTTTDSAEEINVFKRLVVTDAVTGGTERIVGGIALSNPTGATPIAGDNEAETNFDDTYDLPANSLKVGTVLRIVAGGAVPQSTGTETHQLALKFDAVTGSLSGNIDATTNDVWGFEADCVVRATGASGTMLCMGLWNIGSRAGSASPRMAYTGSGSTSTITVDTTQIQTIAISIDHQASRTDTDTVRMDFLIVSASG